MDRRSLAFLLAGTASIAFLLGASGAYLGLRYPRPISQSASPTSPVQEPQRQQTLPAGSLATTPTPAPTTPAADLPELYPGVQWETPETGEFLFATGTHEMIKRQGYRFESVELYAYPSDFLDYYVRELASKGWIEVEQAGGPGGDLYSYEKDGRHVMFGYRNEGAMKYRVLVQHD